METLLRANCEKLIQMVKEAGADECDVILSKGESFSLSAQGGEIDKYKVSGAQVIGVRVIKDSKVGLSYSENFDEDSLKVISLAVVENAKNSEVNEYEKITVKEGHHLYPTPYIKDDSISIQEKIDFCLGLESEVRKRDKRVQSVPYNGFSETSAALFYLNSNNVSAYKTDYYQSCYTSALLQDNGVSSSHHHGSLGRTLKSLDSESCINETFKHRRIRYYFYSRRSFRNT